MLAMGLTVFHKGLTGGMNAALASLDNKAQQVGKMLICYCALELLLDF